MCHEETKLIPRAAQAWVQIHLTVLHVDKTFKPKAANGILKTKVGRIITWQSWLAGTCWDWQVDAGGNTLCTVTPLLDPQGRSAVWTDTLSGAASCRSCWFCVNLRCRDNAESLWGYWATMVATCHGLPCIIAWLTVHSSVHVRKMY